LSFEANQGQADKGVQFVARGPGYTVALNATEAAFTLTKPAASPALAGPAEPAVVRMQLLGSNPTAPGTGVEQLPGQVNYVRGQDRAQWHTGVPTYAKVEYQQVYPGVDLVYYGNQQHLEYDFIVAPGADPSAITLAFASAGRVDLDARGDLVLHTAGGDVREHKPFIYQEVNGVRQEIPGGYVLNDPYRVGFQLGAYDPARPLVIDPVLASSTYFGGDGYHGEYFSPDKDTANDIAVDAKGDVYVTGATNSLGRWDADVSVVKFDPTLSTVLYATFLDGWGWDDIGNGIAVDAAGNAYVTGSLGSVSLGSEVFAAKLDATGSPLGGYFVFFGSLDGYGVDTGHGIAVDLAGNAYVTGETGLSAQFPTTPGAFQPAYGGGWCDAFVVKLNGQGAFVYSTYLGGSTSDEGYAIAVDAHGNAYVTGATDGGPASAFPTTPQAFQPTSGGGVDAFVTKLNAQGSALVYSTCLGGILADEGHAIAVDAAGNAYVTGTTVTLENDFPVTPGAFQTTADGGVGAGTLDAFVTKLNADGSALVYSSYLGRGGYSLGTEGYGIAVDAAGNAYVTGDTIDFPTVNPFQGQLAGMSDAFVTRVNPAGSALIYSSYLGGSASDVGLGIAVNAAGNVYVAGTTSSLDFPTTPGAYQPHNGGGDGGFSDAFITKIAG
jgi:hypothetical protein